MKIVKKNPITAKKEEEERKKRDAEIIQRDAYLQGLKDSPMFQEYFAKGYIQKMIDDINLDSIDVDSLDEQRIGRKTIISIMVKKEIQRRFKEFL